MSSEKITIDAVINAPAGKVWSYWTGPGHITQWNFASDDWCCPRAENDLKVGGRANVRMEARDGSFGFDFEYQYNEVEPNRLLVYTLDDGRMVRTTFDEQAGKTHVTTIFDAEKQNPAEMQRQGWQAILNNFKAYVESH